MNKLNITGATGLVGTCLLSMLPKNWEVTALSRRQSQKGFTLTDYSVEDLTRHFAGSDAVIHLAGRRDGLTYADYLENVTLTESVLKAAKAAGVKQVVLLSSISVYSSADPLPFSEAYPPHPASLYGASKLHSEYACIPYMRNINICILRCAHIFGREDKPYMIQTFMNRAYAGLPLHVVGKSLARREYIYVKDVCRALCMAVETRLRGTFNLGTGIGHTNLEIARIINRAFRNDAGIIYDDFVPETIEGSWLDVQRLRRAGFQAKTSLYQAARDQYLHFDTRDADGYHR